MTEQSFEELYQFILNRKKNPEKGSYTDYLFDKGIDKILKKIGEEAAEVIIGAKNDRKELTYESADLIFHLMVLLVNENISLQQIKEELGSRIGKKSRLHERNKIEEY